MHPVACRRLTTLIAIRSKRAHNAGDGDKTPASKGGRKFENLPTEPPPATVAGRISPRATRPTGTNHCALRWSYSVELHDGDAEHVLISGLDGAGEPCPCQWQLLNSQSMSIATSTIRGSGMVASFCAEPSVPQMTGLGAGVATACHSYRRRASWWLAVSGKNKHLQKGRRLKLN
jgi:hypothetical protein